MTKCDESNMPRECAAEFRAGAERMARIETKQDVLISDMSETKKNVQEIKDLINKGKGAGAVVSFLWACIGGIGVAVWNHFTGSKQ